MTLTAVMLPAGHIVLRRARRQDLEPVIALLAADQLRASTKSLAPEHRAPYKQAFNLIDSHPAHLLVVGTDIGGAVVATSS